MSRLFLSLLIFLYPVESSPQDLLLDYMRYNWIEEIKETPSREDDQGYSDQPSNSDEGEAYSWELGTPDNIPETVIIYELKTDCY